MSITITTLPPDRWEVFRTIRLASLAAEPRYGRHHRDEAKLDEGFWRTNIKYGVFALDGATPVGLVLYSVPGEPGHEACAKIYGLHVAVLFRRRGIGGRLFGRILGLIAEQETVGRIILAVDRELAHAVRLYSRHGFKETAEGPDAGGGQEDELLMEKLL